MARTRALRWILRGRSGEVHATAWLRRGSRRVPRSKCNTAPHDSRRSPGRGWRNKLRRSSSAHSLGPHLLKLGDCHAADGTDFTSRRHLRAAALGADVGQNLLFVAQRLQSPITGPVDQRPAESAPCAASESVLRFRGFGGMLIPQSGRSFDNSINTVHNVPPKPEANALRTSRGT